VQKIDSTEIAANIYRDLQAIRLQAPLVHNITNFVVMQLTANALLALGASPIMAHALEELADIIKIADSLVLNIGTIDANWLETMKQAIQLAKQKNIPIILDPVGAGASKFRTDSIQQLLTIASPTIIRGNASEINALVSLGVTKGVDSILTPEQAKPAAQELIKKHNCTIVISGATDFCLAKDSVLRVKNGSALMAKVTGMGCTASALIAAFCAINPDAFAAATHAMTVMSITGEIAASKANGPGSFQLHFYDVLYNLSHQTILEHIDIE
jgi:hydroxyethylthiazole kinase